MTVNTYNGHKTHLKNQRFQEQMEDTKGLSEFVNRRSIDKTMEKIKRTKGQTTIYKTLHKTCEECI
jgi:ferritin